MTEQPRGPGHVRLLGCCLVLALLPFLTNPGQIIADSKFELVVDPNRFLSSALTMWNPQQFGQLQDQVVGYLFPMGPFFELGRLVLTDGWVIQRLWISAVLILAFTGTVRLADRLGIGTPMSVPVIAAGFAYALSPVALAMLGELSAEFLPAAMLPWILIPLVDAAHGRQGRVRAAATSAVAVALCGGVNGAATAAVLIPAGLFILTSKGWRLLAWWLPAMVLATLWWSVPLVLQSKYGVSIVPYTESADVTTSVTSLSNVLRGTDNWVSYLVVNNGQIWWPLGYRIATQVLPALLTGLIAALGLAGLIRRDMPARTFQLSCVLTGVLIISAGYVSSLGNPAAGMLGEAINGPASAFRNLWKFDPLIRLPVVLGLAHLLQHGARVRRIRIGLVPATAVAVAAIGGLALPAFVSGLAAAGSFGQVPSYWVAAANWVSEHAGRQAVLVAPGASFGQYTWGSPMDDVLASLTDADFAERDLSVIGSPGNERLLDAIDQRLAAGTGSAGLAQVMARMGIKYVVVRNDLSRNDLEGTWPARVSQALEASPGISQVARFGPLIGSAVPDDAATNFDPPYPAVQIYQVAGASPVATVQPAVGTLRVYGAPESLLTLADAGLLAERPVLLNGDGAGLPVSASILTDSLRRRVRNFGELRTSYSPTLTATQPASTFEATEDYTEPGWSAYASVARYSGIKNVTASSSASDIQANPAQWGSGLLPYAAVDGDTRTMWESGSWTGPVGQWIQVDFDARITMSTIQVAFADNPAIGPPVSQVTVQTAAGRRTDVVQVTGDAQPLRMPAGASGWLRITVTGLAAPPVPVIGSQVGIADISVPGVQASRTIVAPPVPGGDPAAVVLAKAQPQPSGCMLTPARWVCAPSLVTPSEEQYGFDHAFGEHEAERAEVRGLAVLTNASVADRYARLGLREATVTASSAYTPDPQDQPRSVFDGDPATTWIASPDDQHPRLTIRWGYPHRVSHVTIQRPPGAAGSLQILITGSGGQAAGATISGASAVVSFKPMQTISLTFAFTPVQGPVQISGITVPGVPFLGVPAVPFTLPCGLGPLISVNGRVVPTRVTGTFEDLLTGQPVQFAACRAVTLAAGSNDVAEPVTDAFDVQDVVLNSSLAPAPSVSAAPATIASWTSAKRVLRVSVSTPSYLVVNENFNDGWRAVAGGKPLRPVQLDGWKQAWLLPAGTNGPVTVTYQPERLYRDAVVGGLAALGLVLLVAAWPRFPARRRRPPSTGPPVSNPSAIRVPLPVGTPPPVSVPPLVSVRLAVGTPPPVSRPPLVSHSSTTLAPIATSASSSPLIAAPSRLRRLGQRSLPLLVACALAAAGLWLGGYPGAAILPAATLVFLVATGYRGGPAPSGLRRLWLGLLQPWTLAVLLLAATVGSAAGEHLVLAGDSGRAMTALVNGIPQVICLVIVARLVAALIIP